MIDFGDDRLTRGRPHPMIDGSLRVERLLAETEDPDRRACCCSTWCSGTGLGRRPGRRAGAGPARGPATPASPWSCRVVGTRDDPQGLRAQVAALHGAGAWVHLSNAAAARCGPRPARRPAMSLLTDAARAVVTAGAALLADALRVAGRRRLRGRLAAARPATADARGGGDGRPAPRRRPTREALTAMLAARGAPGRRTPGGGGARPRAPGSSCTPARRSSWERASGPLRGALIGAMLFEGLADTPEDAERRLAAGDGVSWEPCHQPGRGRADGRAWSRRRCGCSACATRRTGNDVVVLAERGARQGAALRRLRPRGDRAAALDDRRARARCCSTPCGAGDPVDVKAIIAQMVQMGDEGHNRNRAGTLMFLREVLPAMIDSGLRRAPTSPRRCGSSPATTTSSSTS